MVINHNLPAGNAKRQLNISSSRKKKSIERLSSGYSINRAADDAAGLSISEKMRGQIRGLTRASENIQDGISFVQTGDGALNEVDAMLQRIRELAVQGSNDTNTDKDRESIDQEVQLLKKEMNRVFNHTEFNTLPIFRAPYIPDIDGMPNNLELYNAADGHSVAGALINGKRYTMKELGCPTDSNHGDWETKFYDNGELIYLKLAANETISNLHRTYIYEADDTGIKINNQYAGTWDNTISQNGDTYSLTYKGMTLSFTVEQGDSRQDIINKLNGDGLSFNSFDAVPISKSSAYAVTRQQDSMTMYVTNSNKNSIANWSYSMVADDTGVGLVQTSGNDGLNHTKTKWSDFSNVNSTGGAHPIADWGTWSEETDAVTLGSSAQGVSYRYTDNASAGYLNDPLTVNFSFPIEEVSREQAKVGLSYDLVGNSVSAPISSISSSSGAQVTGYRGFNTFEFQRDRLLRNFGTEGSSSDMSITVERKMVYLNTEFDHEYRLKLSKAYAKLNTTVTKYSVTQFGEMQGSPVFLDADGNKIDDDSVLASIAYDSSTPLDQIVELNKTNSSSYKANTGLNASYTNHTDNTGTFSDAGTRTVIRNISYQDGAETKTGTVQLTYKIEQATRTVTDSSYEKSGESLANYYQVSPSEYRYADTSAYYVMDSDTLTIDTDGKYYRAQNSSDGTAQRYISTGGDWVAVKTYDRYYYSYSAKNSDGTEIMTARGPEFIYTGSNSSDITIHSSVGETHTIKAEGNSSLLYTSLYANGSYGASMNMTYTQGVGNRSVNVTIKPSGKASRTFTSQAALAGSASETNLTVKVNPPQKLLNIQAGANSEQNIELEWPALSNSILGISGAKINSFNSAQAAIGMADEAMSMVNEVRAKFGAYQNRMEYAFAVDRNTAENLQYAESRIRDTDMAEEMLTYSKSEVLENAAMSMMAQANQQPDGILKMLS